MGWPLCAPEEQIAIQCFDDMWKVDVGFRMVERSGKMSCPIQVCIHKTVFSLYHPYYHLILSVRLFCVLSSLNLYQLTTRDFYFSEKNMALSLIWML